MRIIFISLFLLASLHISLAQKREKKPLSSTIKNVTVYQAGAEINRTGNTTINNGTTYLKLKGLSPSIDPNSLQVKGKGNFVILSVSHKLNYLDINDKPKEVLVLEDSIKSINKQLAILKGEESVYNQEESMLLANKSIGNKEIGVDALDLEEVANLFRKRLLAINLMRIEIRIKQKELKEEHIKISKQLAVLNANRNKSTGEIEIAVSAKERTPAKFSISYFIHTAGWTPTYDLRAEDINKPILLDYKAKVYQNSGISWSNVKLTLSTLNPKRSGTKPILNPWTLNYYVPKPYYSRATSAPSSYKQESSIALDLPSMGSGSAPEKYKVAETTASYTKTETNQLSVEFIIEIPYTIPSDGLHHDVNVGQHELPANFKHFAVPKMDLQAFLLAKVSGWEDYKLLSGNANIYFDGTYVGKSYINTQTTSDTLDLSFGRDNSVIITRERIKDFMSRKIIGVNKKETHGFEISVRNNNKNAILISVVDQIPLSSNKEIEIEIENISGAHYSKDSGKLVWDLEIAGGATKKLKLVYSVKYPKEKKIANL